MYLGMGHGEEPLVPTTLFIGVLPFILFLFITFYNLLIRGEK